MRLHRPVLAGLALGAAVLPVTAASAATGVTAAGSALSSATLVDLSVGALLDVVEAQTISVGSLTATAQSLTSAAPSVTFTPITQNGVKTGAVTVTPANSPQTVGGVSTGALPLDVVSATSPAATLTASNAGKPSSSLTTSLGSVELLGLPVTLDGGLDVGSVTDATHAQAGKGLTITDVSLPNLADILAALGIDIMELPLDTLNALVNDLRITLNAAAEHAFSFTNDAAAAAQQAYDDASGDVTAAMALVASTGDTLTAALSGADLAGITLPGTVTEPLDAAEWSTLDSTTQGLITTANPGVAGPATAYKDAQDALALLEPTVAPLLATLNDALDDVAEIVEGLLAGVPLLEVASAQIATKAAVGSAKTASITGAISGVKVLGNDILADVTGDSELDVAEIAGDLADDVNAALNTVSAALSNALSSVTGATGLVVPAPQIEVMKKTTKTGTDGAFGTASNTLTALSVSLGSATIPSVYALDGAGDLPGIAAVTSGFKTAPLSLKVGTLADTARFRPAGAPQTPTTGNSHPSTGAPQGLAIVAVIGTALAIGVRRFRGATE